MFYIDIKVLLLVLCDFILYVSFLQSLLLSPKILSTHPGSRNIHHIALAPAAMGPEDRKSPSAQEVSIVCMFIIALIR